MKRACQGFTPRFGTGSGCRRERPRSPSQDSIRRCRLLWPTQPCGSDCAAALPAFSRVATAQGYPSRPVRLVVGFAAGSTTDILAGVVGQWPPERLGKQFIIETRPGAAGNIAAEAVVKAPADGYTLLMVPPASAINATLYDKLGFNFLSDMAPVAGVVRVPNVVEVNPSVPVKTVPELVDHAKRNPGALSFASAGIGTASHLAGELFK